MSRKYTNKSAKKSAKKRATNRSSFIYTRPNYESQVGGFTITARRDPGTLKVSLRTSSDNSTVTLITRDGEKFELSGHETRTLQRALNSHYQLCGAAE
jgi:hypothetical protein